MDILTAPAVASAPASSFGIMSSTPPVKTRAACNRCHSQKIRCVRRAGQLSCERCVKLHTSCRFSPRTPRASSKPTEPVEGDWHVPFPVSAPTPVPDIHGNGMLASGSNDEWLLPSCSVPGISEALDHTHITAPSSQNNVSPVPTMYHDICYPMQGDMQNLYLSSPYSEWGNMNWPDQYGPIDMDLTPLNQNTMSLAGTLPPPRSPQPHGRAENHESDNRLLAYPKSTIRDLANLNVALYESGVKLPCMPEAGVRSAHRPSNGQNRSKKVSQFAIDEILNLTTEFIDIMKALSMEYDMSGALSPNSQTPPNAEAVRSLVAYTQELSNADRRASTGQFRGFSHVDEATMLIVMSCHCRLIDTYVCIFKMMQDCIAFSKTPKIEENTVIILPRLQFGTYASPPLQVDAHTSPPASITWMYMSVITMLSSPLCDQVAEVMRWEDGGQARGGGVSRDPLLSSQGAMWEAMAAKTGQLSRTIGDTKRLLQR